MNSSALLPALNLFTLVAIAVVLIGAFIWYMRKPSNRHPMDSERGRQIDAQRTKETLEARADETPQPRFNRN